MKRLLNFFHHKCTPFDRGEIVGGIIAALGYGSFFWPTDSFRHGHGPLAQIISFNAHPRVVTDIANLIGWILMLIGIWMFSSAFARGGRLKELRQIKPMLKRAQEGPYAASCHLRNNHAPGLSLIGPRRRIQLARRQR